MLGVVVVLGVGGVAAYATVVVPREREAAADAAARQALADVVERWGARDLGAFPADVPYAAITDGLSGLAPADLVGEPVPGEGDAELTPVWPRSVALGPVERDGDTATGVLTVTWPLGPDGWTYDVSVEAARATEDARGGLLGTFDTDGGTWEAEVTTRTVHPDLADGGLLDAQREVAERGDVLGRDGEPVVEPRNVVEIGVQPSRVEDLDGLTSTFARVLDIDGAGLAERVRAAGPDEFVPVITLRREDYEPVRDVVRAQTGVVFREGQQPLAPTRAFARATLGRVGPATAELVEASGGRIRPGDTTGLSGLLRQYDERLAGSAGFTVVAVSGEQTTGLFTVEPTAGEDVTLGLDEDVQVAADQAAASAAEGNGNVAVVAIDVPTGDVVAVANTPVTGTDRALTGTYPPGSTFKTVSTLAFLRAGLDPAQTVPCPRTATVDGRAFGNVEDSELGDVPFSTDFARSCNTAFVGLAQDLEAGALTEAADAFGIGGTWDVGVPTATGSVPVADSDVERAAASIGQGRVLASPLVMAQVAATVAGGEWRQPRLVLDPAPAAAEVAQAEPERLATVRDLMRAVVTDGSASALADVPGEPVHAKTGTAEYGTEQPPRTHAWVVGFQGDLAFAVLVEDGGSGSRVAVPVAETFLRLLQ